MWKPSRRGRTWTPSRRGRVWKPSMRGRVWKPSRLSCTPSTAICAYSLPGRRSVSTPPYMTHPPYSTCTSTYTVPYTAYLMTTWRLELLRRVRRCASDISIHYPCRDVGPVARTEVVNVFGTPSRRRGTADGLLGSTGAGDVASGGDGGAALPLARKRRPAGPVVAKLDPCSTRVQLQRR